MRRHSLGASSRVVTHEIVLSETTLRISANYTVQTKQTHTREADSSFDELGWVKRRAQIAHGLRMERNEIPPSSAFSESHKAQVIGRCSGSIRMSHHMLRLY